jgi:hypothetical protein
MLADCTSHPACGQSEVAFRESFTKSSGTDIDRACKSVTVDLVYTGKEST